MMRIGGFRVYAMYFNGKRYTQGFMNGTDYFPYLEVRGSELTFPALETMEYNLPVVCNVKWKAELEIN